MLHNYNIKIRPDATGIEMIVPGLVDANLDVVMPLVRYQQHLFMRQVSQSKLQKVREAVRLFYEYSAANLPHGFGTGQTGNTQEVRHWEHFRNFRHAIVMGTFSPDGFDPSGLNWVAQGMMKAESVVRLLTEYFIWLDELDGGDRASRFNPLVTPTSYEAISAASAYEYQRSKALLGHTWAPPGEAIIGRRAASGERRKAATKDVKRITNYEFNLLLQHGFDATTEVGLRDIVITILMNKGGVRPSEALGAWVIDVMNDPMNTGSAHVKLKHPTQAEVKLIHKGRTYNRRVDYLRSVHGLSDRITLPVSNRQHLGWKSRFDVLEVYWAEPWWGRVFWRIYCTYLGMTATKRGNHPYLVIDSASGDPLAYDTFAKSYERAVYRAGLVPPGVWSLKDSGLTAHANRHAYGDRLLNEYGCSPKVVQTALHHVSPESQVVYTTPSAADTQAEIGARFNAMSTRRRELDEMKQALRQTQTELATKTIKCSSSELGLLPESIQDLMRTD